MAILNLNNPFTMTVEGSDDELNGFFRDFTKEEHIAFQNKNKKIEKLVNESQSLFKSVKRAIKKVELKEKLEDYLALEKAQDELYELEDKLDETNTKFNEDEALKNMLKERFDICLGGKDAEKILELAEIHGYEKVYETITDSIVEHNEGK